MNGNDSTPLINSEIFEDVISYSDKFEITINLSVDEVMSRLLEKCDVNTFNNRYNGTKYFLVKQNTNKFEISRNPCKSGIYRDSFEQYMYGEIESISDGCKIKIHFGLNSAVKVFLKFFLIYSILFTGFLLLPVYAIYFGYKHLKSKSKTKEKVKSSADKIKKKEMLISLFSDKIVEILN